MKKLCFLIAVFALCVLVLAGCGVTAIRQTQTADEQSPPLDTKPSTSSETGKSDVMRIIDPLRITEAFGKNVLDVTSGTNLGVDYAIYPYSNGYKYKYLRKTFNFMGENQYSYYSYFTPLDASLVQSAEYEVFFDGSKNDIFIQKFKEIFDTLSKEYGTNSIYQIGYTKLDESEDNITSLTPESMIDSFKVYKDGVYYISWKGPDYLVHMRILLDNKNRDKQTDQPYFKVILAFDKSETIQKIIKNSSVAYEVDKNALLSSVDPLFFTWMHLLGNDISNLTAGKTDGKDYYTKKIPESDSDCSKGPHTEYTFHPWGITFMGQSDPSVVMAVPNGSGVFSISYLAAFNKDNNQNLVSYIANLKTEYNNLCKLYGQPTTCSVKAKDGSQKSINFDETITAITVDKIGSYSFYWNNTPDGNVVLYITNSSEEKEIFSRISFTE